MGEQPLQKKHPRTPNQLLRHAKLHQKSIEPIGRTKMYHLRTIQLSSRTRKINGQTKMAGAILQPTLNWNRKRQPKPSACGRKKRHVSGRRKKPRLDDKRPRPKNKEKKLADERKRRLADSKRRKMLDDDRKKKRPKNADVKK